MNLPDPCEKCAPFAGAFMETPKGMRRCDCARGAALVKNQMIPEASEPVLSEEDAYVFTEMLAGLDYFPPGGPARALIADEIAAMCADQAEATWLVKRISRLFSRWPGIPEMRRVYCNKHRPLDGLEAVGESEYYPDGYPSEKPAAEPLRIAAGTSQEFIEEVKEEATKTIEGLAELKDMNRTGKRATFPGIPVVEVTSANRITPEQIAEAARLYREAKAKQEQEQQQEQPNVEESGPPSGVQPL